MSTRSRSALGKLGSVSDGIGKPVMLVSPGLRQGYGWLSAKPASNELGVDLILNVIWFVYHGNVRRVPAVLSIRGPARKGIGTLKDDEAAVLKRYQIQWSRRSSIPNLWVTVSDMSPSDIFRLSTCKMPYVPE